MNYMIRYPLYHPAPGTVRFGCSCAKTWYTKKRGRLFILTCDMKRPSRYGEFGYQQCQCLRI